MLVAQFPSTSCTQKTVPYSWSTPPEQSKSQPPPLLHVALLVGWKSPQGCMATSWSQQSVASDTHEPGDPGGEVQKPVAVPTSP